MILAIGAGASRLPGNPPLASPWGRQPTQPSRPAAAATINTVTVCTNAGGPLGATIRTLTVPSSLPVLTIADPELVLASWDYVERVAIQVLQYLLDLDHFRGVGRLFVP